VNALPWAGCVDDPQEMEPQEMEVDFLPKLRPNFPLDRSRKFGIMQTA
jgi:hypothetical protein